MSNHAAAPHIMPLKMYLGVGFALLVLTVLTVLIAEIPLGGWNLVVALLIASIKALLVAFFFMHLYYDNKLYFIIFSVAIVTLATFITLTMFDSLDRGLIYEFKAQPINPNAAIYNEGVFKKPADSTKADTFKVPPDTAGALHDTAQTTKPGK